MYKDKFYKVMFSVILSLLATNEALDEKGCGTTKFCLQYPDGCSSTSSDCIFFTYYYNSSTDAFDMELSGSTGSGNNYGAVGFTTVNKMMDSDVYICTGKELKTGVIEAQYDHPILDTDARKEITNVHAMTDGGVASCSFTRANNIKRTVSDGVVADFNLFEESFYVIYAIGKMNGDGQPQYHDSRGVSKSKVAFTLNGLSSECGKTIGCFQSPKDCKPGTDDNCQFFSWFYDTPSNQFKFQIVGKAKSPSNYQAFAFTKLDRMEDADVYYCTSEKVGSAVIAGQWSPPTDVLIDKEEITDIEYSVYDGSVVCSFSRAVSVNKTVSKGATEFDLTKNKYYLLYSTAVTSASGGITRHLDRDDRGVSSDEIDFTTFTGSGGGSGVNTATKLIRAHAVLMMLAWMLCCNIGIVVARHYKPMWPDSDISGQKVWFQIHRSLMTLAVFFTCLGIILAFSAVKGFSSDAGAHPIIGLVVTGLALLNPIMAFYRPHPGTENRKIFNSAHYMVGASARILAVATIFLGLGLPWVNLENFTTWIMLGGVLNQVLVEIVLEVLSAVYGHVAHFEKFHKYKESNTQLKGQVPKYLLLLYVVLTNIGFVATLIYYVYQ